MHWLGCKEDWTEWVECRHEKQVAEFLERCIEELDFPFSWKIRILVGSSQVNMVVSVIHTKENGRRECLRDVANDCKDTVQEEAIESSQVCQIVNETMQCVIQWSTNHIEASQVNPPWLFWNQVCKSYLKSDYADCHPSTKWILDEQRLDLRVFEQDFLATQRMWFIMRHDVEVVVVLREIDFGVDVFVSFVGRFDTGNRFEKNWNLWVSFICYIGLLCHFSTGYRELVEERDNR